MKIWRMESELDAGYKMLVSEDERSYKALDEFNGKSLEKDWVPLELEFIKDGTHNKKCDTPALYTGFIIFNKKTVETVKSLLKDNVEILDVNVIDTDDKYYAINVIDVGEYLDHDKCEFKYFSSGKIMRCVKFAFKANEVKNKHIFKISEFSGTFIFVSDEFKKTVEMARLKGFEFTEVWDSDD